MTISYISSSVTTVGSTVMVNANTLTIVAAGVTLVSTGGDALRNLSTSDNCDVRIDGTLIGNHSGVALYSDFVSDAHSLTVGTAGVVLGDTGPGAAVYGDHATLVNYGQIGSDGHIGAQLEGANCVLTNYGDIYTHGIHGVRLTGTDARLENHGTITSTSRFTATVMLNSTTGTVVINTGIISGPTVALNGSALGDRIVNQGTISGRISTLNGNDTFAGAGGGGVDVDGGNGLDTLRGGGLDDTLAGGADADRLVGGGGDDRLHGGTGTDFLRGGAGEDLFVFATRDEMGNAILSDRIADFATGEDMIDLRAIAGLSFIGNAAFSSVADQMRYAKAAGQLQIDQNGDGVGDFFVQFTPGTVLVAADLLL